MKKPNYYNQNYSEEAIAEFEERCGVAIVEREYHGTISEADKIAFGLISGIRHIASSDVASIAVQNNTSQSITEENE